MVKGLDGFKAWFIGYESYYAIIGGTACDMLMSEVGEGVMVGESVRPCVGSGVCTCSGSDSGSGSCVFLHPAKTVRFKVSIV